jgi:vibriolysin
MHGRSNLIYALHWCAALAKAMSDIFGALVEHELDRVIPWYWKIGEECYAWHPRETPPYMNNPKVETTSVVPNSLHRMVDIGGVHWNSGIANLAFFLLVEGGIHPRAAEVGSEVDPKALDLRTRHKFSTTPAICLTPNSNFESAMVHRVETTALS